MPFNEKQTAELEKKLHPDNVKPPAPGKYGDYLEGWFVIAEANRIFGFDGWSYAVEEIRETHREKLELQGNNGPYEQWRVSYLAVVSAEAGGVRHVDVGHGQGQAKPQSLGDAIDSAVKEAATDGLKRALRCFGNPFGLALYDKTKANVGVDVDWATERDDLLRNLDKCEDIKAFQQVWQTQRCQRFLREAPEEFSNAIIRIKDERKAKQTEAA